MFWSFEEWKHRSLDYLQKQRFVEIRSITTAHFICVYIRVKGRNQSILMDTLCCQMRYCFIIFTPASPILNPFLIFCTQNIEDMRCKLANQIRDISCANDKIGIQSNNSKHHALTMYWVEIKCRKISLKINIERRRVNSRVNRGELKALFPSKYQILYIFGHIFYS